MHSFYHIDTALPFFLRMLGLESLRSVCIEGVPCFDYQPSEIKVQGISSKLQKLLVKLKCSSKEQYGEWTKWVLFQIKAHVCLKVVVIEPLSDHLMESQSKLKEFFTSRGLQED